MKMFAVGPLNIEVIPEDEREYGDEFKITDCCCGENFTMSLDEVQGWHEQLTAALAAVEAAGESAEDNDVTTGHWMDKPEGFEPC